MDKEVYPKTIHHKVFKRLCKDQEYTCEIKIDQMHDNPKRSGKFFYSYHVHEIEFSLRSAYANTMAEASRWLERFAIDCFRK